MTAFYRRLPKAVRFGLRVVTLPFECAFWFCVALVAIPVAMILHAWEEFE